MKLLVVTVTYKADTLELDLFIKSFLKFNDIGNCARLVVVDNSPEEYCDVRDLIQLKYSTSVGYIPNPSNPGFGASNNIGFKSELSDYVLFINNDVEFTEPVFGKIISKLAETSKIGCIGIHQNGGAPSFFCKVTAPKGSQTVDFDEHIHFISGAFMFFKSDVFLKIGLFDENIFMYSEEFDISERLILNGYSTEYLNNLSFLHKVENRRIQNEYLWKIGTESFCYVCKKYHLNPYNLSFGYRRLFLLFFYFLIQLNIKECGKIIRIIFMIKSIVKQNFPIRKSIYKV